MYLAMPDPATDTPGAFDALVDQLARGAELDAGSVVVILAANGRSMEDLEHAIDRRVTELDIIRMGTDGGPHC
jgi:hypothetical protein